MTSRHSIGISAVEINTEPGSRDLREGVKNILKQRSVKEHTSLASTVQYECTFFFLPSWHQKRELQDNYKIIDH